MSTTLKTIALITGANQGIGAAVSTILASSHAYHVLIGCRILSSGESLASSLTSAGHSASAIQLDLTSDLSIAAAVQHITETYGHLDVLINNAGILIDGDKTLSTRELFEKTFATNVTGTACVIDAMLPLLRASSQKPRVIFVSSRMGSLVESLDPSRSWYQADYKAYDASKAAVNILTANYARILADKEARVNSVCPGLVKTNLTGYIAYGTSTEVGATRIVELATVTGENSDVKGTFSDRDGVVPW